MKKSIIILAVCAVLVIGGSGAAVYLLRNQTAKTPTESTVPETSDNYYYEEDTTYDTPDFTADEESSTQVEESSSNFISTVQNSILSTTRKTTNRVTTTTKPKTTKKTQPSSSKQVDKTGIVPDLIGEGGQSFLGYRWSSDGYYYCDDKDCWQKNAGYNEVYDKWAPVAGMWIDQVRIRFQYGGKNWMIQIWKGQYGVWLLGAEIGVYTCALDEYKGGTGDLNHFDCADKEDWLYMQLDCYYAPKGEGRYNKIFTRPYDKYWWATGFVQGQVTKYTNPITELKVKGRITFKSDEMANIFVQGLKLSGFRRAGGADALVDDSYFMNGKDVWVLWSTINHDAFVGY